MPRTLIYYSDSGFHVRYFEDGIEGKVDGILLDLEDYVVMIQGWYKKSHVVTVEHCVTPEGIVLKGFSSPSIEILENVRVAGSLRIDLTICRDLKVLKEVMSMFSKYEVEYPHLKD